MHTFYLGRWKFPNSCNREQNLDFLDGSNCQGWITVFVSQATVYMRRTHQEQQLALHQSQMSAVLYGIALDGWMVWLPRRQEDVRKKPYLFLELFNHDTLFNLRGGGLQKPRVLSLWAALSSSPWASLESKMAEMVNLKGICIQKHPCMTCQLLGNCTAITCL